MTYEEAVRDLVHWRSGHDFFTCKLYDLMTKADPRNFAKLSEAFPTEALAFSNWLKCSDEEKFFSKILESKNGPKNDQSQ
jgi:hypothetical protein